MSKWDKLIVAVAIIAVALFAYVLATQQMSASFVSAVTRPAGVPGENREQFDELKEVIDRGGLAENQFGDITADAEDYTFIDYTLKLSGICPFPAKWATMSITPVEGDIAIIQSPPASIAPFVGGYVTGTLLTSNPDADRTGWIEYYVLGRMNTAKTELIHTQAREYSQDETYQIDTP